jgi:hypothetical protein
MMRAELRHISPNDYRNWEAFASAERPEPWDDFGWFVVEIAPEGDKGSTAFQVLVTTPAAVTRAKGDSKHRRFLLVDSFEPDAVAKALREYVAGISAHTWDEIVEKLQRCMYWEYGDKWG